VLLVLGGILGILYLWRRWRTASQPSEPDIEPLTPTHAAPDTGLRQFPEVIEPYEGEVASPSSRYGTSSSQEAILYEEVDVLDDDSLDDELDLEEPEIEDAETETGQEVVGPGVSRQFPRPGLQPEQVEKAAVVAAVASAGGMTRVGEYRAHYEMGTSDYDEAFDIFDTNGAYIGQCGLELVDPVGKTKDQAAALQVWLWDTNDPDTKVKVLMSEGAYRDTALRDQLAADHEVMPVGQGSEFDLRSYNLLLKGIVDKVEYAEQEPMGSIFSEMQTRLAVYLK
jgi:hypothetical protein